MTRTPIRKPRSATKVVRVGLLGFGTVGRAFAELLDERRATIEDVTGVRLELTRVAVRDPGRPRENRHGSPTFTGDALEVVSATDVDVVVELIGGTGVVKHFVLAALNAGKPVITANKELLGNCGPELFAAADAAQVDLYFEAAAVAAVPILRPMRESLPGEQIAKIIGIVNGTTNFILTRMMAERLGFDQVLSEAQQLGYAEPDPTADIDGTDARSSPAT
jgi:homoserine dehydrogenase